MRLSYPYLRAAIVYVMFLLVVDLITPASAQTFNADTSLPSLRYGHTSTTLQDGTVLIAGGCTSDELFSSGAVTSGAVIYNPKSKTYTSTKGPMIVARYGHSATLLNNGMVLIAGGEGYVGGYLNVLSTAEIYDPANGEFHQTGSMSATRAFDPAVLLLNGTVLFTGGSPSTSAEVYAFNPTSQTPYQGAFVATGDLVTGRYSHSATLLGDGSVLIAGGQSSTAPLHSAEIYFPSSGQFSAVGDMISARSSHTASLLYDGTVLVAGGFGGNSSLAAAEIYNPSTLSFSSVGPLHTARDSQTATALRDGTILLAGGESWSSGDALSSAEVYSVPNKSFSTTGNMSVARDLATASLLSDGTILVAGGDISAVSDLYTYPFSNGSLNPKYIVLDVIYAPPGTKSYVNYGTSTMVGTSTSISKAFTTNTTISASIDLLAGILGGGGTNTYTASDSYSQESDTSSSVTVNETTSNTKYWYGPVSSAIGVDHDYDVVQVWLNPATNLTIPSSPQLLLWSGYTYDPSDTYSPADLDVINIPVICLKNFYSPLNGCNEADLQKRIQRAWDSSGTGGLTASDYAQILQSDPFATNADFDPSKPNADGSMRFDEQSGETVPYQPPVNGQQSGATGYTFGIQKTSTAGQGASDTKQVTFSVKSSAGSGFLGDYLAEVSGSYSMQWVNKWSTTQTNTTGSTVGYSITGPDVADNYQGPTSFQVYKDNVYGTLMLYSPGFEPNNPGVITVNPTSLTFPSAVSVGSNSAPIVVTLTNGKNSNTLAPSSMQMATPVAAFSDASFTIVGGTDTCSGQTVALNASCSFSAQFSPVAGEVSPTGTTPISGTMYLTGLAGAAQTVVEASAAVNGTGQSQSASVSFTPTSLTFAPTNVGSTSATQTVTITNTGSTAVSVSSYAFTGSNASSFVLESKTCGSTLAVGANCTLSIAFEPTVSGALSASLAVSDTASGSPQAIPLSGTGGTSTVSLSPSSLAFPATAVGSTSSAQTVTVTNTGTTSVSVTSYAFTGTNSSEFIISSKTCGTTLAVGANCALSIAFKPTANGTATANLAATDSASGSPQTLPLTGTGGTTTVSLSPTSLAFPSTDVGYTSAGQTITVTNTGTNSVTVTSYTFTGTNASEFLLQSKTCGTSLAVGTNCTLTIAFKPTAAGAATANLAATDNASGSPQTDGLSGTGVTP